MTKEFIPYEQALALKELGFNLECVMYVWDPSHKTTDGHTPSKIPHWTPLHIMNHNQLPTRISLPLYQQAFRWFREKHNLVAYPSICSNGTWSAWFMGIPYNPEDGIMNDIDGFTTYEEAELACLNKLIELVKQRL